MNVMLINTMGGWLCKQKLHNNLRFSSSGNRTPGSRFYSDLLDTMADFVCIHQLILKRLTYGSFQLTHMSRDDHAVQLIKIDLGFSLYCHQIYTIRAFTFPWRACSKTIRMVSQMGSNQ